MTIRRWLAMAALALCGAAAWAQGPSDSFLQMAAKDGQVSLRWDIALRDLDRLLGLDADGNGELSWGEVRGRERDITAHALRHLELSAGPARCSLAPTAPMQLEQRDDGTYAVLSLAAPCPALAGKLRLRYWLLFEQDPSHRGIVLWNGPNGPGAGVFVLTPLEPERALPLRAPTALETTQDYLVEGVRHIWIGWDHILFLLALLAPAVLVRVGGRWEPVQRFAPALLDTVKVVTAFTLAHSITLSLAALGYVSLPPQVVEPVIAASVVLAALNNLRPVVAHGRWVVAFAFGLVHGFGFASVLGEVGLPAGALALALASFNLGVELGQLAIVAVFLPLAFALRRTRAWRTGVVGAGSLAVAVLAAWWLAQRLTAP